jgi:hypothetical protein
MMYRRAGAGFTLYSVGPNYVDDGGVSNLGKPDNSGDDVYWPQSAAGSSSEVKK